MCTILSKCYKMFETTTLNSNWTEHTDRLSKQRHSQSVLERAKIMTSWCCFATRWRSIVYPGAALHLVSQRVHHWSIIRLWGPFIPQMFSYFVNWTFQLLIRCCFRKFPTTRCFVTGFYFCFYFWQDNFTTKSYCTNLYRIIE